jgi:hypothetical protein
MPKMFDSVDLHAVHPTHALPLSSLSLSLSLTHSLSRQSPKTSESVVVELPDGEYILEVRHSTARNPLPYP